VDQFASSIGAIGPAGFADFVSVGFGGPHPADALGTPMFLSILSRMNRK